MKQIVVIGGGVSGLAAAYKLKRAADEGHDVSFTLVETDARLGGKIAERGDGRTASSSTAARTASSRRSRPCIAREAHRASRTTSCPTDEARKGTWILSRGKLHKMPDGVMMFAPTKFVPFATTGLFTWPGKIRAGMDLFIPRKERWAEGETARDHDETLESFVTAPHGPRILDRLAEPLVGGVHASDPPRCRWRRRTRACSRWSRSSAA